jgi:hypothetical protein
MKKQFLSLVTIMLISLAAFAQPPHGAQGNNNGGKEKREKVKAMKVEFITSKLELTSSEAEKFWPIYNEFSDEIHALEKARRKMLKEDKGVYVSDEQTNKLIASNFDTDQKILNLKKSYDVKFKKVLSVKKVGLLYHAEHQFRSELLKKMKGKGNVQHKGGPPNE